MINHTPHTTDQQRPLSRRRRAFDDELTAHLPDLRNYALSLTRDRAAAEDLVQDCVVRALRRRNQFRPGTHLGRWLFTILRNLHIDGCRQRTRRGPHVDIADTKPAPSRPPSQEQWVQILDIAREMHRLRPCDRDVLILTAFSRLSQKQIARRLEVAEGTVRSRLSRARASLSEHCVGLN
jgi:RNA polymerase sigma-70 factor (ECF subfamily)